MSAIDTRRLKELSVAEYALRKKLFEAKGLKRISTIPPQPEKGYYMTGEGQAKYKREAKEYNAELRRYKEDLRKAWSEVRANRRSIAAYDRLSKQYISRLKQSAPQRKLVRQQREEIGEYLRSVGPPTATTAQRARAEAGLPQVGLPGPAAVAPPGSLKARLGEFTGEVLGRTEAPFRAVTDPLRSAGLTLERLSHEAMRTEQAFQPPTLLGAQTQPVYMPLKDPFMVEAEQKPVVGFGAYLGSVGLGIVASGVDVATFEVRPGLMAETATGVARLGLEPETRREFVAEAARDPFRFLSTVVGGALVGAELQAAVPRIESATRKWWAKRTFDQLGLDETVFTPFEQELLLDFPEETVDYRSTQRLFKRKELATEKGAIPYYLETTPELEHLFKEYGRDMPDPWGPKQVTKPVDSYYALPFSEKGEAILVKGKAGMKPFKETQIALPPRSEQVAVLTTKTPSTAIPKASFFKTHVVETVTTHVQAFDLRSTLFTAPKIMIASLPSLIPALSVSALLSVTAIPVQEQLLKDVSKQVFTAPQLLKDLVSPQLGQIQPPKPIQVQPPTQAQIPDIFQVTVPKQDVFTVPKVEQITIQEPKIPQPPTILPPDIFTPSKPPITPIRTKKKKKKKKPISKKRKALYEKRVDPLKITFPKIKTPKVPKI